MNAKTSFSVAENVENGTGVAAEFSGARREVRVRAPGQLLCLRSEKVLPGFNIAFRRSDVVLSLPCIAESSEYDQEDPILRC